MTRATRRSPRSALRDLGRMAAALVGHVEPAPEEDDGFVRGLWHADHPNHADLSAAGRSLGPPTAAVSLGALRQGKYGRLLAVGELRTQPLYWLGHHGGADRFEAIVEGVIGLCPQTPGKRTTARGDLRDVRDLLRETGEILARYGPNITGPVGAARRRVFHFLHWAKNHPVPPAEISRTFRFPPSGELAGRLDRPEKAGEGWLGCPTRVVNHRGDNDHAGLDVRAGDHVGHLIAVQFGAPDDARNVSSQSGVQNAITKGVGWGSYFEMENKWAGLLKAGAGVYVRVTTYDKPDPGPGSGKRFTQHRAVEFVVYHTDGTVQRVENVLPGNFPVPGDVTVLKRTKAERPTGPPTLRVLPGGKN